MTFENLSRCVYTTANMSSRLLQDLEILLEMKLVVLIQCEYKQSNKSSERFPKKAQKTNMTLCPKDEVPKKLDLRLG